MKVINRLKKDEEFKKVLKNHKVLKNETVNVFYQKNELNRLRIGISVSKKIGNAVIRVKVRRQIRAFIAIYNNYQKGYDIVIVTKRVFTTQPFETNYKSLISLLNKATQGE